MTSPMLTADQLLAAPDLPEKTVDVPEWGGQVKLKALNAGQWRDVRQRAVKPDGDIEPQAYDAHFLIEAMVEPKLSPEQFGQLMQKNPVVITRLTAEALALTNVKGVEAAAAGFREGPGDDVGVRDREAAGDDGEPTAAGDERG